MYVINEQIFLNPQILSKTFFSKILPRYSTVSEFLIHPVYVTEYIYIYVTYYMCHLWIYVN